MCATTDTSTSRPRRRGRGVCAVVERAGVGDGQEREALGDVGDGQQVVAVGGGDGRARARVQGLQLAEEAGKDRRAVVVPHAIALQVRQQHLQLKEVDASLQRAAHRLEALVQYSALSRIGRAAGKDVGEEEEVKEQLHAPLLAAGALATCCAQRCDA